MNNSLNWMLEGLKYPRRLQFSVDNQQEIRGLVVWLENQKIRFYKPADRAALTDVNSSNWNEVFSKYLKDVECPISFVGSNMKDIVSWMLKHAVSLEYSDRAKEYNGYAATRAFKAQNSQNAQNAQYQNMQSKKDTAYADADQEEFQKLVQDLLRTLQVDTSKGTLADHLKEAKEILEEQVLPGLHHSQDSSGNRRKGLFDMSQFPLGFKTGDKKLDIAATVLRILYIKDLRNLQSQIDHGIVELQEYTANPKTDSRLGRVGH
eukprot:TRINITY_DN4851_c0_g1_i2.p1 TRINITY_DN4851_c0_g1~~TRINITY_DN4851_c0_g1_i2.p1  ORF type:complete len:263 (+),score=41.82 TRINITY_DN4851_c0_g1_i2:77-865(+)